MHIHLSTDSTSSGTNESTHKSVTYGKATKQKAFGAILVISALILLVALIAGFYGWKPHYEGM